MDVPDFERTYRLLAEADDTVVRALSSVLRNIYGRRQTLRRVDRVRRGAERGAALWSDPSADDIRREAIAARLPERVREAQAQIELCWKCIVHFLPFLLIATLRRLDDDVLRRDAAKPLARVLQYELLVSLRRLTGVGAAGVSALNVILHHIFRCKNFNAAF